MWNVVEWHVRGSLCYCEVLCCNLFDKGDFLQIWSNALTRILIIGRQITQNVFANSFHNFGDWIFVNEWTTVYVCMHFLQNKWEYISLYLYFKCCIFCCYNKWNLLTVILAVQITWKRNGLEWDWLIDYWKIYVATCVRVIR